jgi:two-component system cell cycle response regulator DivK
MSHSASSQTNTTILYVEDNPDNRMLVRRILMAEGYVVIEAVSAQNALDIINGIIPDLILMDINMPDLDGYQLTARIRNIPALSKVPVIALTANVMKGDKEKSLAAGCDGYIQKPIDVDALPVYIQSFLRKH